MAAVPIGTGCTLQAVKDTIIAGAGPTITSLQGAINAAIPQAFNPTYYTAPATSLAEFQGYEHMPNQIEYFNNTFDLYTINTSTPNGYVKCLWEDSSNISGQGYRYYPSVGIVIGTQFYNFLTPYAASTVAGKFIFGNTSDRLETFKIVTTVNGIITNIVLSTDVTKDCSFGTTTTTTAGDITPPSQVTGLFISDDTGEEVRLNWTAATDNVGVTGYEYSVSLNGSTWDPENLALFTSVFIMTNPSTLYYFRVRAYDAAGNRGAWSNTLSHTTSA
jgi:hypothetical protein